jgi:cholesterol transport system auxiliary component
MKAMNKLSLAHSCRLFVAGLSLIALCACSALRLAPTPHPALYSLEGTRGAAPAAASAAAPTLIINPPNAAAGFDSPRIIYVRETHKLEYFAHSEWVDPPARMLAPLLVAAIENSGAFRAVVLAPSTAAGDLRLDTEIIRLQHEFQTQPSRVRFTLRAYLVDDKTRRVLAWREFDAAVPATSDDPYGGVVAANRAVQTVLENLSAFCAEAARSVPMEK